VRNLSDCFLYGILDLAYVAPSRCEAVIEELIAGGADLIQLRGKNVPIDQLIELASRIHELTRPAGVPLIANDHPQIAMRVPLQGVHVGQDDTSIEAIRDAVRRPIWVGKSTHSFGQAESAQHEGADYIGFGPLYPTPTKPDYQPVGLSDLTRVHGAVHIPIFCIGGIKLENLPEVISAGAKRVVIVSGLLLASDIVRYARGCKDLLAIANQRQTAGTL
jgi:thiamine-phosphate pyrophosphorylase